MNLILNINSIRCEIYSNFDCMDAEHGEGRTHCEFQNICFDPKNAGSHNQWEVHYLLIYHLLLFY
jgi:hypothetical protein